MRLTNGIMVIDDDVAVQNVARAILEEKGYQVWTASNESDALLVLAQLAVELRQSLRNLKRRPQRGKVRHASGGGVAS